MDPGARFPASATTPVIVQLPQMRVALLLLAVTLCSCARTHSLAPAEARAEINRRAEGRTVVVTLRSGQRVQARALRVDVDSASWLGSGDSQPWSVATSDVAAVTGYDVNRGAADGFWIGLGTGLAAAPMFYAPDRGSDWNPLLKGGMLAVWSLGMAGCGALIGTLSPAPRTYVLDSEAYQPAAAPLGQ